LAEEFISDGETIRCRKLRRPADEEGTMSFGDSLDKVSADGPLESATA